jgi:hypothetical protein
MYIIKSLYCLLAEFDYIWRAITGSKKPETGYFTR